MGGSLANVLHALNQPGIWGLCINTRAGKRRHGRETLPNEQEEIFHRRTF